MSKEVFVENWIYNFDKEASMPTLLDRMIRRITREGHLSGFTDEQVLSVLRDAKTSLEAQPAMLEIEAPVVIFGDIHGQLRDLLRFFTIVGAPPENKILFLGDYVDRCKKSLEVIILLLCYRIKYPHLIHLLRGNHECSKMNRLYGFYEELRRKRSVYMWKKFQEVFNEMPLCAVVSTRLLCMHGGISPEIHSWESLQNLKKPKTPRACDDGIAVDLMWSDPSMDSCTGFQFNAIRATSYVFGGDTIINICNLLDIDMVVRAHEVVKGGHQFMFDRKLLTIFSAPNYCGTDGNAASVVKVSAKMELSFVTLKPRLDTTRLSEEKRLLLEKMTIESAAKSPDPYVRPFTGSENKMKIGNNDDNLIGPIGTSGTDLQAKDKLSFNNENQQPAEAAHLSNFLTVAPTAKENAIPSLPSDPQKFAKSALTVTPEQRQVFTTEKSSNENRASSNLVGPTTEKPSNEIKASSNIVVPLSVDSMPERTEKRSAAIATKSHSPKKRDTVPTIDSNAQGPEGMSTHPYKTITITKTSWENNSSVNESVVRKSPAKTKGVVSTTVSLNQSGGKRLESGSSPSRTPPPNSHTVPSNQQKPHEFSVPTNPPVTSKPSPISPRIGGNNCTTPAPILSSSSSQAKEKKSSAARQSSTGGPRSPRRALSSPAPLGLNNIESDSSSLSTISDKTNLTTKPYSPTNGKLKSSTKPRSVEEAAKAAIVARKTPHHPLPKDSKKIIHDTEKALNNPFLTSPRK